MRTGPQNCRLAERSMILGYCKFMSTSSSVALICAVTTKLRLQHLGTYSLSREETCLGSGIVKPIITSAVSIDTCLQMQWSTKSWRYHAVAVNNSPSLRLELGRALHGLVGPVWWLVTRIATSAASTNRCDVACCARSLGCGGMMWRG